VLVDRGIEAVDDAELIPGGEGLEQGDDVVAILGDVVQVDGGGGDLGGEVVAVVARAGVGGGGVVGVEAVVESGGGFTSGTSGTSSTGCTSRTRYALGTSRTLWTGVALVALFAFKAG
jgi:hypothetical protein